MQNQFDYVDIGKNINNINQTRGLILFFSFRS